VVFPLDANQEVKNTYFARFDTRVAGKLTFLFETPPPPFTRYTVCRAEAESQVCGEAKK